MSAENELEVLFPSGIEVKVGSQSITVKPLAFFGQAPKVTKLLLPILSSLASMPETGVTPLLIASLITDQGEDLMALMGYLLGKERDWFDTISVDEGVSLAMALYQVNKDFVTKKVMGSLLLTGAISLPSSAKVDTPE